MGVLDPSIVVALLSMLGTVIVGFWSWLQQNTINKMCSTCPLYLDSTERKAAAQINNAAKK